MMYSLVAPGQGGAELSTWRVELGADAATPVQVIVREQVWMPVSGSFEVAVDGRSERAGVDRAWFCPPDRCGG
ncbi:MULTISPECIES: hypothetical protein [unclassified Streptomyces]|uniref:hypothetical protein n=1 Tax=unclassified Streptomyces TaxID=2593676 RepID=UPI001EF38DFE|nr:MULTISPECIES: hypothetical protein [unclassified Streptomyces]